MAGADGELERTAVSNTSLPRISKYEVLSRLASGGMGEVFLAQRLGATELAVIKRVHEHLVSEPAVRARFLREAQVSAMLVHPRIAKLTDAGIEDDRLYLAVEYVPGLDLRHVVEELSARQRLLPRALAVQIAAAILEGLEHAHALADPEGRPLHLVHRDLSSKNVMLSYSGDVKLIDFGLVRASLGEFRTEPGAVMGTPQYMSPEQVLGQPIDRRSDLYSWAAILFELFTARAVVRGSKVLDIFRSIISHPAPKLSELAPDLPLELEAVIAKGLEKDVRDRFQTAREAREALLQAAESVLQGAPDPRRVIAALLEELFREQRAEALAKVEVARRSGGGLEMPTRAGPSPLAAEERTATGATAVTRLAEPPLAATPIVSRVAVSRLRGGAKRGVWLTLAALFGAVMAAGATYGLLNAPRPAPLAVHNTVEEAHSPAPRATQRPAEEKLEPARAVVPPKERPKEPARRPAPALVSEKQNSKPDDELQAIRALLAHEDSSALLDAEARIRALSEQLPEAERAPVLSCLASQMTAPNDAAWRDLLLGCVKRLEARLR